MNAIDINGIIKEIRNDQSDMFNISALADYLEEKGDVRGAQFVRNNLSTRKPVSPPNYQGYGWWARPKGMILIDPDDIPVWLWNNLKLENQCTVSHMYRKLYPTEEIAYTRLFDALLKGDE